MYMVVVIVCMVATPYRGAAIVIAMIYNTRLVYMISQSRKLATIKFIE